MQAETAAAPPARDTRQLAPVSVCCALFVLSGAAGLIYEATWVRYLKSLLGHDAYAQALVLSLFLGGLAVGAALAGRALHRVRSPLVMYAAAEAVLALAAIYFHDVYTFVRPQVISPAERWATGVALILPQSVLLGTTFPMLAAALVRGRALNAGRVVAMLYFSNSIGGVLGVLSVGLVLVDSVGLPGSMLVGGVGSAAAGFAAWVLHHRSRAAEQLEAAPAAGQAPARRHDLLCLLVVALGTGMASLIYEVVWIRMIALVVGSSTRAFELMLAVFILGLAMGGLYAYRLVERANRVVLLAKVQLVMGVLALGGLLIYPYLFELLNIARIHLPLTDAGYVLYGLTTVGISLILMFAPTFCAGMTLPLLTRAALITTGERSLGQVYAWNTVGSIAGIVVAVHLLMPLLGLRVALAVGAAIDIALALMLFARARPQLLVRAAAVAFAALCVVVIQRPYDESLLTSGAFRIQLGSVSTEVLYAKHGKTSSVAVVQTGTSDAQFVSVRNNGKSDSSVMVAGELTPSSGVGDDLSVRMLAALPLMFDPQARRIAVIGFGTGMSTTTALKSRHAEQVVTAEIETAVLEGGREFKINAPAYEDPRSLLLNVDAKSYFAGQPADAFDIIISSPTNPWVSGMSSLFSQEHFQEMHRALGDDGLLLQWLQLYETEPSAVASVLAAIDEVFGDYVVFNIAGQDIAILTSPNPRRLDKIDERAFELLPELADELAKYHIRSVDDIAALALGDRQLLQPYMDTFAAGVNSDYFPVLDAFAARGFYLRTAYDFLRVFGVYGTLNSGAALPTRRFRREFAQVTPSPFHDFQRIKGLALATLNEDAVLADSIAAATEGRGASDEMHLFAAPCPLENFDQALDVAADLEAVMERVFQHLYPPERARLWRRMTAELPCLAAMREVPEVAGLIDYYEAVALSEPERVIAALDEILPENVVLVSHSQTQALLHLMLAHMARSDYDQALATGFRAGSLTDSEAYFKHALRLVGAHASAQGTDS